MNISETKLGYFKVATCVPRLWVGDVTKNTEEHLKLISRITDDTRVIIFPELSLTGYTCGDILLSVDLKRKIKEGIN